MNNQVILAIPDLTVLEELDPSMQEFLSLIGMVLPTSRRMPGTRTYTGKMIIHAQVKPSPLFIDTFVTLFKTAAFADWELIATQTHGSAPTGEKITKTNTYQQREMVDVAVLDELGEPTYEQVLDDATQEMVNGDQIFRQEQQLSVDINGDPVMITDTYEVDVMAPIAVYKPVPATFIDYMEDDVSEDVDGVVTTSRPTEMKLHKFASAAPWVLA